MKVLTNRKPIVKKFIGSLMLCLVIPFLCVLLQWGVQTPVDVFGIMNWVPNMYIQAFVFGLISDAMIIITFYLVIGGLTLIDD